MKKKVFRTAFIGAGMITNCAHLPAMQVIGDSFDVVGVSDIRENVANETAKRFNITGVYTDNRKMLEELKPDLVVVATPNSHHKEASLMALRNGANVICEKPVALKYQDAVDLFNEADKLGLNFFPAQTMRFWTEYQAVKRIAGEGSLGDIYYVHFDAVRRRGIPKWGFFHMKDYNVGGPFCDLAVHEIDMILWALNNPKAVTVSGNAWTKIGDSGEELQTSPEQSGAFGGVQITPRPYDWHEFDVEDLAAGIIRLEGGTMISFKTSWAVNLPDKYERQFAGTKAGLVFNNEMPITIYSGMSGWQTDMQPKIYDQYQYPDNIVFPGHVGLLKNVIGYLYGEEELVVRKEQTLNVTSIIEAFYSSVNQGREISCNDIVK